MKQFYPMVSKWQMALMTLVFMSFLNFLTVHASPLVLASNDDWVLQSEKNGVKLFYKLDTCEGKNVLFLKFENSNPNEARINYTLIIESPGHNLPTMPQAIVMKGNETRVGTCDSGIGLTTDIKEIKNPTLRVVLNVIR